jgi:hypothetical protein
MRVFSCAADSLALSLVWCVLQTAGRDPALCGTPLQGIAGAVRRKQTSGEDQVSYLAAELGTLLLGNCQALLQQQAAAAGAAAAAVARCECTCNTTVAVIRSVAASKHRIGHTDTVAVQSVPVVMQL